MKRDPTNLNIFWLKDDSLKDTENLPEPDVCRRFSHEHKTGQTSRMDCTCIRNPRGTSGPFAGICAGSAHHAPGPCPYGPAGSATSVSMSRCVGGFSGSSSFRYVSNHRIMRSM